MKKIRDNVMNPDDYKRMKNEKRSQKRGKKKK